VKFAILLPAAFLVACGSAAVPPDWESNAYGALNAFQQLYLRGDSRGAEAEFKRARAELASTGNAALVARAELVRCAVRTASLEFDECPGFEKLRADAGSEEQAYADFLSGKIERKGTDDSISRLVDLGVQFKAGRATPESIASAVNISSAQGWRRPLLAWLGVQEKRAESAGDAAALESIRRRIALVSEKS
jgi:hypothetical protein